MRWELPSSIPYHHRLVDYRDLIDQYPPPLEYFRDLFYASPDRIRRLQTERLAQALDRAWRIPFHRRRWEAQGIKPGDVRSVEDLPRLPAYTIEDIRDSLERFPPYGDYQGVVPDERTGPTRIFWSGGTTGTPRPTVFTPWDREVGAILSARTFLFHGIRPGDLVANAWAYSTHNAAWIMDQGLYYWLGATPITTSTGIVTPSERLVELVRRYGAQSILATSDYLVHLARVARNCGFDPRKDFAIRSFSAFGETAPVIEAWGVPAYDSYAFHEVQYVAAECPDGEGLHIFEDAFVVEVVDVETGEPLPDGEVGNLVVTALYKTGSQQIRYNIQDLSRLYPPGRCRCGSWMRRMDHFLGRSDNMVKLKGVNIWPEALGRLVQQDPAFNGEYFVVVERRTAPRESDEMTLSVEAAEASTAGEWSRWAERLAERIWTTFGVHIRVQVVAPGSLAQWTGHGTRAKLKRFEDRRPPVRRR